MMKTSILLLSSLLVLMADAGRIVVDQGCARKEIAPRLHNAPEVVEKLTYPFMVALFKAYGSGVGHICGGAVINKNFVLTALHCVVKSNESTDVFLLGHYKLEDPEVLTAVAGDHNLCESDPLNECVSKIKQIIPPRTYPSRKLFVPDLALLKLKDSIMCHERITSICLPNSIPVEGSVATLMGWGFTEKNYKNGLLQEESTESRSMLRHVQQEIHHVDLKFIRASNGSNPVYDGVDMGDSGSPLVQYREGGQSVIIGVASYASKGLTDNSLPVDGSYYATVYDKKEWIRSVVSEVCQA